MFSSEEKNFRQRLLERVDQNKLKIDNLPLIRRLKPMGVIKNSKVLISVKKSRVMRKLKL